MSIDSALKRLGYTNEWIEFGILTEEEILAQYDEINTSEDQNAEHYRAGSFQYYLSK